MTSKRPAVLMAILLVLLGVYFALPYVQDAYFGTRKPSAAAPTGPVPAANAISNFTVTHAPDGRWIASLDYAYTGQPKYAVVRIFQVVTGAASNPMEWQIGGRPAQVGTHHFSVEVLNPNVHESYTTDKVFVVMDALPAAPILKVSLDQRIRWPDPVAVEVEQALASGKTDALMQKVVGLIDSNESPQLAKARGLLQMLVEKSPRNDAAYVELGRVSMKTNWGPTGLRDAENLIGSALQIAPDSVNAKILLGYVYAHQGRYKEAEALFAAAAPANPPNLWLWANWGEVLAMQGRNDAAIVKYREAVSRPPTGDTYDQARLDAFSNLQRLLAPRGNLADMESLLKQRAQEYAGAKCFSVDYARFLVLQRGDASGAREYMREFPSPDCSEFNTRMVQGLAHYMAWAQGKGPERADSLRQARVFLPVSPRLFYELAASERGLSVARQLLAAGEKVDMQDDGQLDALAYALRINESATARKLLQIGANPLAEVGPEKMPAALIPVINRDFDGIRVMQRAGIDYGKLRYQGATALEYARKHGDTKLQQALDPKAGSV